MKNSFLLKEGKNETNLGNFWN